MRILCRHGHFAFYPRRASDIFSFAFQFNVELEREEDYYTFANLKGAPKYSILGKPYMNALPAMATYAGQPWEVMKENGFVYNVALGLVVPKLSILGLVEISQNGFFYVCNVPLIQAGARTITGKQILSYSGEYWEDKFYLRIVEFSDE